MTAMKRVADAQECLPVQFAGHVSDREDANWNPALTVR